MTEPVRDAATIILLRDRDSRPAVLMGQRGARAAFMPDKMVFPGGAVDPGDADIPLAAPLPEPCRTRLAENSTLPPEALAAAALRELMEETGLLIGAPAPWTAPPGWEGYARAGLRPDPAALHFVFRAVTPPGRPRRFDARFFLADAAALAGDPDALAGEGELAHLQWVEIAEARRFDLPFITEVVLAEIAAALPGLGPPTSVPWFRANDEAMHFARLGGASPLDG